MQLFHPCTLTLRSAWEEVCHEDSDVVALEVLNVVDSHFVHVLRSVRHFDKLDAEETFSHVEHTFDNVVEFEVRTHVSFVEVELFLLHLFSVVIVVPRSDFEAAVASVNICLHILHFFSSTLSGRSEDLHHEVFSSFRSAGHNARSHHLSEVVEAHDSSLLSAESDDLLNDRDIACFASSSECSVALVHCFTETAVVGILKHRETAWSVKSEHPETVEVASLSFFSSCADRRSREACEILFIINYDEEVVGSLKKVAVVLDKELRQLVVDLYQFFLLFSRESSTLLCETTIVFFDYALLNSVELHLAKVVINALDALE